MAVATGTNNNNKTTEIVNLLEQTQEQNTKLKSKNKIKPINWTPDNRNIHYDEVS